VTSGAFRISRHPMYLGMTTILAGTALCMGTLTPWIPVVGFVVAMSLLFIPGEERRMESRFGDAYRTYRTRTRRWF